MVYLKFVQVELVHSSVQWNSRKNKLTTSLLLSSEDCVSLKTFISPHPSLSVTNVTSLPLNGCCGRELSFRKVYPSPYKGRRYALLVVRTINYFKTTFHFQLFLWQSRIIISFYVLLFK